VISFAVWAAVAVQAYPAIRLEGSAENYHADDAVNGSQHINEMGSMKHNSQS
jgi:hypothetical protein